MIWESRFWKDDLLRRADAFAKRRTQRRWPEASFAKVEQDVMLAAYSIRRLAEAIKLSDDVRDRRVQVRVFPATGYGATRMNWHKIERLYDLDRPSTSQLGVADLCNQIIHSYVFIAMAGPEGLQGFFVASDRQRNKGLYEVSIDAFIGLLREVGENYPDQLDMRWNDQRQDCDVTARTKP